MTAWFSNDCHRQDYPGRSVGLLHHWCKTATTAILRWTDALLRYEVTEIVNSPPWNVKRGVFP